MRTYSVFFLGGEKIKVYGRLAKAFGERQKERGQAGDSVRLL